MAPPRSLATATDSLVLVAFANGAYSRRLGVKREAVVSVDRRDLLDHRQHRRLIGETGRRMLVEQKTICIVDEARGR